MAPPYSPEYKQNQSTIDRALAQIHARKNRDYESYSEDELTVLRSWVCVQVIENGGLGFLFERAMPLDDDYSQTISSLDAIGASKAADILRDVTSQFPRGRPPLDRIERCSQYQGFPEEVRNDVDGRFIDEVPSIAQSLVRFIQEHQLIDGS